MTDGFINVQQGPLTPINLKDPIKIGEALHQELGGEIAIAGETVRVRCPCHDDETPSLQITRGNTVAILVRCWAGCKQTDVISALVERKLWHSGARVKLRTTVDEYPYQDQDGNTLFIKKRIVEDGEKTFEIGRADPAAANGWKKGMNLPAGLSAPLYRLPELLAADPNSAVFFVEGEKDVETLQNLGCVATTNLDGAGKRLKDVNVALLKDRHVVLIPDNDAPGFNHCQNLAHELLGTAASIRILELPDLGPKEDVSDWVEGGGTKKDLSKMVGGLDEWNPSHTKWERQLLFCVDRVTPKNLEHNYVLYLKYHDQFRGRIKYDEFRNQVQIDGEKTSDTRDTQIICQLQALGFSTSRERVTAAINTVAEENSFDPLQDYLLSLTWDGIPRVDAWLTEYMSAAKQTVEYRTAVGRAWLVACVARAMDPGSQADQWLIVEGAQGVGKSTGLAALMPDKDWFQDQLPDVNKHAKDAVMALDGKWLIEIAEMNAIRKADREAVKQFASVRYDKIRRPYARHVSTRARRCHMACTHNPGADDGYFTDSTGSRRWLPVEVGLVHVEQIKKDRDQLWAEALILYRKGFNWWLEPEEVGVLVEQRKRFRVSDSADEAFHYLEYQPVITDTSNPTNLVIEWRKRDQPLTAFVPKYFWQDRFDQDWVKAPYMVKQDINGAFQNKGWSKVSRRFPELATEHNDPTSRCLRAWVAEDDTGVEDPGTPEISNTTETNARHIEERRGVEQPTSETAPTASGVEEEVLNPDKCNDVCDSPKSLKEEKKEPPLYTDTPLYTIEDIEDKEKKALASERVRESYSETGPGRRGVASRRLFDFDTFLARFGKDEVIGLDLETTSLSPRTGRVRLIQVYRDNAFAYLDLDKVGGLSSLRAQLEGRNFVAFNAAFELTWFKDAGIEACFDDAMLAYSAVYGGGTNLKDAAQKILGIEIDKTQQRSDWSGDLTDEQITYALRDAEYASMLWSRLVPEMTEYGVLDGYYLMLDAIPAINAMSDNGMGFDLPAHNELIQTWVAQKEEHENTIDSFTTTVENWNSPNQIQTWIRELLIEAGVKGSRILRSWPRTKTDNLSVGAPAIREVLGKGNITGELKDLLEAYLRRQDSSKLLSSFGEGLQGKVIDGRLRGSFSIGYAKTGRMTSFKPNLQNLPNTPEFRGLFVAGPGNQIVVADYSQVEVRVGGILGNEKVLEEIFKTGQDVHTTSAAAMFHKDPEEVTKDERKQAKALTFGTQYGMGPLSLSKMMGITREKAVDYLSRWDMIYPALATWRKNSFENGKKSLELRTAGGRRIEIPEDPSPTICFNYPVQGSSADVIYAALKHMEPRYDQLLAVVHDEIVLECPAAESEQACADLEAAMTQGFLDIFPGSDTTGLVDAVAGGSWAIK